MLNLRARQYEPAQMRFSQRDLLKGDANEPLSLNRYLYCTNDPVNYVDANGLGKENAKTKTSSADAASDARRMEQSNMYFAQAEAAEKKREAEAEKRRAENEASDARRMEQSNMYFAQVAEKAEKQNGGQRVNIRETQAVQSMLSGRENLTKDEQTRQDKIISQAQADLDVLYASGAEVTQKQIDSIIAAACTKLLNDKNRKELGLYPNVDDGTGKIIQDLSRPQQTIPAYTDAISELLQRLREKGQLNKDVVLSKENIIVGIFSSSVGFVDRYYNMLKKFKNENAESGDMNLRNPQKWETLISSPALDSSQYVFVYNGQLFSTEDMGNIAYGYYGTASGISKLELYLGAGYAAVSEDGDSILSALPKMIAPLFGDNPEDREAIDIGIEWYRGGVG